MNEESRTNLCDGLTQLVAAYDDAANADFAWRVADAVQRLDAVDATGWEPLSIALARLRLAATWWEKLGVASRVRFADAAVLPAVRQVESELMGWLESLQRREVV